MGRKPGQEFLEDKKIIIPNRYQGLPVVGIEETLWGSEAEEIVVEDGVRIIEETAFDNCRKLKKTVYPKA